MKLTSAIVAALMLADEANARYTIHYSKSSSWRIGCRFFCPKNIDDYNELEKRWAGKYLSAWNTGTMTIDL